MAFEKQFGILERNICLAQFCKAMWELLNRSDQLSKMAADFTLGVEENVTSCFLLRLNTAPTGLSWPRGSAQHLWPPTSRWGKDPGSYPPPPSPGMWSSSSWPANQEINIASSSDSTQLSPYKDICFIPQHMLSLCPQNDCIRQSWGLFKSVISRLLFFWGNRSCWPIAFLKIYAKNGFWDRFTLTSVSSTPFLTCSSNASTVPTNFSSLYINNNYFNTPG